MKTKVIKLFQIVIVVLGILCLLPKKQKESVLQSPLDCGVNVPANFGDVILVPGSGCNPGIGTIERLNLASKLYQERRRKVIVSEGTCFPHERAQFMERMEKEWKIDRSDITWDTLSRSTVENLLNAKRIMKANNWSQLIICTSPFHQLRCKLIARKTIEGNTVIAKMPNELLEYEKLLVYRENRLKVLYTEYVKILYALFFV